MKVTTDFGLFRSVCLSKCFNLLLIPIRVVFSYPLLFIWIKTEMIFELFCEHSGFMLEDGGL